MNETERELAYTGTPSVWGLAAAPRWVVDLALPVLWAEYGIPRQLAVQFPQLFDKQENEWRGVEEVLALCERYNMDCLHEEAIAEDAQRFPKPIHSFTFDVSCQITPFGFDAAMKAFGDWTTVTTSPPCEVGSTKSKKPPKSKFWTAPAKNYNPPPKLLAKV